MPKLNCCVPACICSSKRTPNISFYRFPKDKDKRMHWDAVCRNRNLKKASEWTSVCSLHFVGGAKTYSVRNPSIFPWTDEWEDVIRKYNDSLVTWNSKEECKVKPLPLPAKKDLPFVHSLISKPNKKVRSSSALQKLDLARNRTEDAKKEVSDQVVMML